MSKKEIEAVAVIKNDYTDSFGIPRQSSIAPSVESVIVFEKEYRDKNALRGIEQYSHLWLVWGFSENEGKKWSPTVRPPKLGGNIRVGVFATRSPFRPNGLGLSCVKLLGVEETEKDGTVLKVGGADLMNGTPIYDIKPYIPYSDSFPGAEGGFASEHSNDFLKVAIPDGIKEKYSEKYITELAEVLALNPKPQYQNDENRVYKMNFGGREVSFTVDGETVFVENIED